MAEHSHIVFEPLMEMLGFTERPVGPFYMKLDKAENFVQVVTGDDHITFTAYKGTPERVDGSPMYELRVSVDDSNQLTASNARGQDVAVAADWRELGLALTRSATHAKYFQMGVLFLLMAGAYTGADRFRVLEPALMSDIEKENHDDVAFILRAKRQNPGSHDWERAFW